MKNLNEKENTIILTHKLKIAEDICSTYSKHIKISYKSMRMQPI